jgi:ribA/ribD-fused uncharacterized protein
MISVTRIDYFGTGADGGDYAFLSNFYDHDGWTVEHHYQAAKTDDPHWAAKILQSPTPAEAKKLGRLCPARSDWDFHRVPVMRALLRIKFQIPEMGDALVMTGEAELVEGNWWNDTYWGVSNGIGENWLGRLLMETRDMLRSTTPPVVRGTAAYDALAHAMQNRLDFTQS